MFLQQESYPFTVVSAVSGYTTSSFLQVVTCMCEIHVQLRSWLTINNGVSKSCTLDVTLWTSITKPITANTKFLTTKVSPFFISLSFLKTLPVSSIRRRSPYSHSSRTDVPGTHLLISSLRMAVQVTSEHLKAWASGFVCYAWQGLGMMCEPAQKWISQERAIS